MSFFNRENIISVFVRLHPFLPIQNTILKSLGSLSNLGRVVNINLSLTLKEQRQNYHRRLKTYINKANRNLSLREANSKEDFKFFKEMYIKTMGRVKAKNFYYFNDNYFESLRSSSDFETETLLAIHNESGKIIAGAMFIKTKTTIQYHLSGSIDNFLDYNGTKFLIDQMRLKAVEQGYTNFNLGGGLGANENDTLFKFKSSFANEYHPFFVWKLITNKTVYDTICEKNNVVNENSNYFPLYRLNENQ